MSKLRVHFTHHACRLGDPHARPPKLCFYDDLPTWSVCPTSWRSKTAILTTVPSEVTCRLCAEHSSLGEHDDHVVAAWMSCCRHRGAPSPLPGRTDELITRERRDALSESLAQLGDHRNLLGLAVLKRAAPLADAFRDVLICWLETLPDVVRPLLRPAIEEYLLGSDVLGELDRILTGARPVIDRVVDQLARREIDVDYGAAIDSPRAAARQRVEMLRGLSDGLRTIVREVPDDVLTDAEVLLTAAA